MSIPASWLVTRITRRLSYKVNTRACATKNATIHHRRQNKSGKIHWCNFGLCLCIIPLLFSAVVLLTTDWRNAPHFVYICFGLLLNLSFFSIVAVAIKRLHDRDHQVIWRCMKAALLLAPAALSSGHDRAPFLRLHRTVPAVGGRPAAFRPSLVVMAFCLLLVLLALWMG